MPAKVKKLPAPEAVRLVLKQIQVFFSQPDREDPDHTLGQACGIYAFYDYDDEPIYVGQSVNQIVGRVRRHLTGQRSDAVGKFILDPMEVAAVGVWSVPAAYWRPGSDPLEVDKASARARRLARYEYAVAQALISRSTFKAILNEQPIGEQSAVALPGEQKGSIVPAALLASRSHEDVRLARRAATIARLAQMVSEREVSAGMRRTLWLQAQRLEYLAQRRVGDLGIEQPAAAEAATPGQDD